MNSYRKALAALALAFVFSTSALANDGVLWTDRTLPPPPPPPDGVARTQTTAPAPEEEDVLTEIVLSLMQTLIPLL